MTQGYSDALAARLAAYQDRLEAAEKKGPSAFAQAWDDPPPGVGVHEIDPQFKVLRANAGDLKLLGYTREEFVGKRVLDFIVMSETAQRSIGRKISGERLVADDRPAPPRPAAGPGRERAARRAGPIVEAPAGPLPCGLAAASGRGAGGIPAPGPPGR